jgi:hypothetical protein
MVVCFYSKQCHKFQLDYAIIKTSDHLIFFMVYFVMLFAWGKQNKTTPSGKYFTLNSDGV